MDSLPILILAVMAIAFILLWRNAVQARWDHDRQTREQTQELEGIIQALRAERTWPKAAAGSTRDLLLVVDPNLRVCYANPAAVGIFGEPSENTTIMGYTRDLEVEQLATDALESHATDGLERVIYLNDQPYRARAIVFPEGIGISLTDTLEVQRMSRVRQEMISNLSHELRVPLDSLRQLANTLRVSAGQDPEVAQELIEKIITKVDILETISKDMLDLAAIDTGLQIVRLIPILLSEVLKDPVVELADQSKRKEQRILVEVPPEMEILADRDQAARAVRNVLDNAITFTPEGEEIYITAHKDDLEDRVVLSIQDSGPGIQPDELERIFEYFYRGEQAREIPGAGFGLAIARQILSAHGGRIWAENRTPPEKGAIFYLAFQPA